MEYRVAARTDVGRRRPQNEDSLLTDLPLFAVADGMGGHSAGEVASQLALEVLVSYKDRLTSEGADQLPNAVQEANRQVWSKGREDPELQGMGTTLTAAWLAGDAVTVAHVGDTRAYLLRDGALQQITEDQTVVYQMEKEGKITAEEAAVHPSRHMLLQAVGSEPQIQVDVTNLELQPGDRLLLASDGLHGLVDDDQIRDILQTTEDADEACGELIDAANAAGGDDNVTVVILDAVGDGGGGAVTRSFEQDTPDPTPTRPGPVIVSKPASETSRPAGRARRQITRVVVGVAAVALILTGVFLIVRTSQRGYLITSREGHAAIVRGTPGSNGGRPTVHEVIRMYSDQPVENYTRTVQRDMRTGIPVASVEEGHRAITRTLPRIQEGAATPSPEPTPVPSPIEATLPPPSPGP